MADRRLDELTLITTPLLTDLAYVESDPASAKLPRAATLATLGALYAGNTSGRLTKSGSNLLFAPLRGNSLIVNGAILAIPDAGITLAVGATLTEGGTPAASTTYYIYAYSNSGTLTLQASATAPTTEAGTGRTIRTGDPTRVLVGMARTTAGVAWVDSTAQRFVLSYFNRRTLTGFGAFSTDRATASASFVELNTEIRVSALTWGDDPVLVTLMSTLSNSSAGHGAITALALDGATSQWGGSTGPPTPLTGIATANEQRSLTIPPVPILVSEGFHFWSALGAVYTSGTATWASAYTQLTVAVRG
jgi:hypothetical protein